MKVGPHTPPSNAKRRYFFRKKHLFQNNVITLLTIILISMRRVTCRQTIREHSKLMLERTAGFESQARSNHARIGKGVIPVSAQCLPRQTSRFLPPTGMHHSRKNKQGVPGWHPLLGYQNIKRLFVRIQAAGRSPEPRVQKRN